MIFCDDQNYDNWYMRYTTWQDAEKGHKKVVEWVKSGFQEDAP